MNLTNIHFCEIVNSTSWWYLLQYECLIVLQPKPKKFQIGDCRICPSIQQFFLQINQKLNEDAHPATSRKNPSAPSMQSITQKHDERGPLSPPPIV
jgi:hypothetical protein